jgi:hypothetical protein
MGVLIISLPSVPTIYNPPQSRIALVRSNTGAETSANDHSNLFQEALMKVGDT